MVHSGHSPRCRYRTITDRFLLLVEVDEACAVGNPCDRRAWFQRNQDSLSPLLRQYGALLVRGLTRAPAEEFARVFEGWPCHGSGYTAGAAPRRVIAGNVFESTHAIPPARIALHQEMAYLAHYPRRLAFSCITPASRGGQTILADMRQIDGQLPPDLIRKLRDRGVQYIRNLRSPSDSRAEDSYILRDYHRTWQEAFFTSDRIAVERSCAALGLAYEWLLDGSISLTNRLPSHTRHSETGEIVWFNQIAALHPNSYTLGPAFPVFQRAYEQGRPPPFTVCWGDGSEMSFDELHDIYAALDRLTVSFDWLRGDILLLDNVITAHGRNPYGGQRDVRVMLFE